MAYDPIINYYDKPGGPSIPGSDSGSGGGDHGGGGSAAGYSSTITDLVHEQTINIIEGTGNLEGRYYSPITVDTQACAGVDGIMAEDGVYVKCILDGTEYTASVAGRVMDNVTLYNFGMWNEGEDPTVASTVAMIISEDSDGNYTFAVNDKEAIGLGSHVIRIYHKGVTTTEDFDEAVVTSVKKSSDEVAQTVAKSIGALKAFERHEYKTYGMFPTTIDYSSEGGPYDVTFDESEFVNEAGVATDFVVDGVEHWATWTPLNPSETVTTYIEVTSLGDTLASIRRDGKLYIANPSKLGLTDGEHVFEVYQKRVSYTFDGVFIGDLKNELGIS